MIRVSQYFGRFSCHLSLLVLRGESRTTDRYLRIAKAQRTVTAVIFPNDVQDLRATEPSATHGSIHTGADFRQPIVTPRAEDIHRAAEILNRGKRVALLVGSGAWNAPDEVIAVAEKLQAGLAKALLGVGRGFGTQLGGEGSPLSSRKGT